MKYFDPGYTLVFNIEEYYHFSHQHIILIVNKTTNLKEVVCCSLQNYNF